MFPNRQLGFVVQNGIKNIGCPPEPR
jgi:hypothetical protein